MSYPDSSLHRAIKAGNTEAVRALLAGGADVNETNDTGQTALIIAIVAGQHKCLRPLLRAGADPWLRDKTGLTAIDWAERKGETQLAQSLSTHSQSETIDTLPSETAKPPALERKIPLPIPEDAPRTPLSPDEKARRYIAGLKQRLEEKAGREPAGPSPTPREEQPTGIKQNEVRQPVTEAVKPEPLPEGPVIAKRALQTEPQKAPVTAKRPLQTELQKASVIAERVVQPESQKASEAPAKLAREKTARQASSKAPAPPPEINSPPIVTRVDVEAQTQTSASTSPEQKPIRGSSKRKRCPQCGTIYNNELLAYCSYDAVALVDEGAPIVSGRRANSSPLLWILVVIVALLGATAGLFVTERLLQQPDVETPTVTTTKPPPTQKGTPVLKGQLQGKELTLAEAEVPANTVTEPTSVLVRVRVDRAGRVYSADSTDDEEMLREAAIQAAKKSTFSVEKLNGRGAGGTITYTFK